MPEKKIRKHPILSHPILGAILLFVYGYLFYQTFSGIVYLLFKNQAISNVFGAIGGALLLVIHKAWFKGEYKGCFSFKCFKEDKTAVLLCLSFILLNAIDLAREVILGISTIVLPSPISISTSLMASVAEEAIFRVLMISIMMRSYKDKDNYWPVLIVSSVAFGCVHLPNLLAGANALTIVLQAFNCMISGIFIYGAFYLRTGSIVVPMITHFLYDIVGMLSSHISSGVMTNTIGAKDIIPNIVLTIIQIIIGTLLLKGKKDDIKKVWNNIWTVAK